MPPRLVKGRLKRLLTLFQHFLFFSYILHFLLNLLLLHFPLILHLSYILHFTFHPTLLLLHSTFPPSLTFLPAFPEPHSLPHTFPSTSYLPPRLLMGLLKRRLTLFFTLPLLFLHYLLFVFPTPCLLLHYLLLLHFLLLLLNFFLLFNFSFTSSFYSTLPPISPSLSSLFFNSLFFFTSSSSYHCLVSYPI